MRTLWGGLLLAAALFAGLPPHLARADSDTSYDAQAIPRCVQAAGNARAALEACKGAGANPCVDADNSTMGLTLCWNAEAETWRSILAAAYGRANRDEPERRAALQAANDAWDHWLDAECTYQAAYEYGGSGVQVDLVHCTATLTADRAIGLLSVR